MYAGHPHYATADAWVGPNPVCAMPMNPLQAGAPARALMVALEAWIREGVEPPASRTPNVADGTLRPSGNLARRGEGPANFAFPAIPGLVAPDSITPAYRLDLGTMPPRAIGAWPVLVPTVDADGNSVAGIRLPVLAAPRATYTGYNPRAQGFGAGALCTNQGAALAFAATRVEREARNDPRLSIAERWPDQAAYVAAVRASAERLVAERLLLAEDAAAMVAAAEAGTLARLR
jgi:hypothetical protein